jgi:thermitase
LIDGYGNPRYSTIVRLAFAYAYKYNRVAAVAMGNDYGSVVNYPAAFGQGIIAVGATTNSDTRAPYSTTGNHIDVSAPGGYWDQNERQIYSTVPGGGYNYMSGTSMATPYVTGIASLLKGYNPSLYNDDIENIIRLSADDKGPTGWDIEYGTGRVNARNALDHLRPPYTLT